ncbi:MAG: HAD hydrolase-like protein [Verrucomicrobia bacterium]|nr:HAD hydrolase-like protein [Verrucomicrobiota bacterium]
MFSTSHFSGLVELSPGFQPRTGISHVVFDFDGTLSLVRQGWPEIMLPMFVEMLPKGGDETPEAIERLLMDDIMGLNGKQTIYQMMRFAERVTERGGKAQEPLWYKNEYLRRLNERIQGRIDGLSDGSLSPEALLVHGSRALLENLTERGWTLYLASGTDEPYVKREAELLDVSRYFGSRIYGAKDDYKSFSKKMVIDGILKEHRISGENLLSFGDGYVEIQNTKEIGGFAVAVASNEAHNGSGRMDEWKRNRLMGVGADVVVPDYRDATELMSLITTV